MSLDLSPLLTLMVLAAPALLAFMLLPTFVEIRKPKDAGPRRIMPDFFVFAGIGKAGVLFLEDIEDQQELDILIVPLVRDALSILKPLDV